MAGPTTEFFEALEQRGHEPLLERTSGTVRADITDGDQSEHWLVSIAKGDLAVSSSDADADCVIQADRAVFDRIVNGEANAMALTLRGAITVQGNVDLLLLFQRLFPGPPAQREQPIAAGYARRHA